MTGIGVVVLTTFLASAVEAIEMATIVLGVGTTRGWRSTLLGAAAGFRKGIVRVAAHGLAGYRGHLGEDDPVPEQGIDWVAFTLAFKGVLLEGLEVAFIVVTFGASAGRLLPALAAGIAAIVLVGAVGVAVERVVARIPRSLLQLVVGTLLTSFGTFWALEGLGIDWPQSDLDIALLLAFYAVAALVYVGLERRRRPALEAARS